jgi:1-acyl-sn-glycerol-3-phosphate acyltransferase
MRRRANEASFLYYFSRVACYLLFRLVGRLQIHGANHVPDQGPVVIVANHRSYADPPLIGSSIKRPVHFLAKKELFSFKPFGWYISQLNAHPLNRTAGIGALREAKRLLEDGDAIIVFPEGRRSKTDSLGEAKPGVGMLSKWTNCPVIPAYIHNAAELPRAKKVSVIFGPPIQPQQYDSYQSLADETMRQISLLRQSFIGNGGRA